MAPKQATAAQLVGCQVKASLAGFRSSAVTIANGNLMDNPDIGTITLHLDEHASGYGVSPTTTAAPKDALKKFDKARSEAGPKIRMARSTTSKRQYRSIRSLPKPGTSLASCSKRRNRQDALASFEKAVAADPQFVPPYEPIAELAATQKK